MSLILQQLLLAARTNIHSSLGSSKSLEGSSVGLAMLSGQRTTFYKELVVGRKGDLCSKAQSPWNLFPFCVITTQISCIHKKFHVLTCTSIHLCHALTFMCYHTHRASSKLSKAWHKSFFLAVLARLCIAQHSFQEGQYSELMASSQSGWKKQSPELRKGPPPLLLHL